MTTQIEQVVIREEKVVRGGMLRRVTCLMRKVVGSVRAAMSFKAENIFKSKEWPYY